MLWKRGFQVVIGLGLLGLTMPVWGQSAPVTQPAVRNTLPEMLPADTLLYIGWPGSEALAEANRATALGKLLAEPEIVQSRQKWREEVWPAIRKLILKEIGDNAQAVTAFEFAMEAADLCWRRPASIALVGVDMGMVGPMVDVAVIVDAGPRAADLAKQLDEVLKDVELPFGQASDLPVGDATFRQLPIMPAIPLRWGVYRDKLVVTLGLKVTGHLMAGAESRSLAESERFIAAMKYVEGSTSVPTGYLDLAGVVATLERFQPMFAGMDLPILGEVGGVQKILDELGCGSMQSLSSSMILHADGIMTKAFLHIPGLGSAPGMEAGAQPITDDDLRIVPKNARWASAGQQNVLSIYNWLLKLVQLLDEEVAEKVTSAIQTFEKETEVSVRDDLLGAFGNTWVVFESAENEIILFLGMTVVADLKAENKLDQSLRKLVQYIADKSDATEQVSLAEESYRGNKITFLNVVGVPMPIAPAWAEYKGRMIFGFFPQTVRATLDRMLDKGDSILANADFQRGRKLMPQGACSVSYVENKAGLRAIYSLVLPIAQVLLAMGQEQEIPATVGMLPSLSTLNKHLFGTVSGQMINDDGLLMIGHGPIPGSIPYIGSMDLATTSMMVSILLPSLARARELSKRTVSAANLSGVGTAMYVYANENDDKFPPNLQTLVEIGAISPRSLISPLGNLDSESSYIYIEGQTTNDHYDNILVYEDPDNYDGEGTNVLFLDSSVRFVTMSEFEQALEETKERLASRTSQPAEEK